MCSDIVGVPVRYTSLWYTVNTNHKHASHDIRNLLIPWECTLIGRENRDPTRESRVTGRRDNGAEPKERRDI